MIQLAVSAQDNSPYSRYGLGDKIPNANVANRGMGGVTAAYNSGFNINYSNPASYAYFQSLQQPNSKKLNSGRAVLNIGAEGQGRTLTDPSRQTSFTSTNLLFSHVMLGVPIRKNWGIALGLRPMTSINYKISSGGMLTDPNSGQAIDSVQTLFEGQGGTYIGSLGTGVKFKTGAKQYMSLGINGGYMFGSRDYNSRRTFVNDSTAYAAGHYRNRTAINGLYFDAGLQYHIQASDKIVIGLGAYGNWKQKLNTHAESVAETYTYNSETGYIPVDTAFSSSSEKSSLIYPSSITGGFLIEKVGGGVNNEAGWSIGADFTRGNWDEFRFNGMADTAVKSNWQLRVGAEFSPAAKKSYLSRAMYRIGFFTGPDYIYTRQQTLPVFGVSGGIGLPLANYSPIAPNQATMINLSFEYIKRGNNDNVLKENLYRLSVGFSLTDLWFGGKTKYYDK
ncbi:membrane protein [Niabella terrae]